LKEALFTAGTKIESVANRYTFVWGKSIKTAKEWTKSQLHAIHNGGMIIDQLFLEK
jgi:hypothetical protein